MILLSKRLLFMREKCCVKAKTTGIRCKRPSAAGSDKCTQHANEKCGYKPSGSARLGAPVDQFFAPPPPLAPKKRTRGSARLGAPVDQFFAPPPPLAPKKRTRGSARLGAPVEQFFEPPPQPLIAKRPPGGSSRMSAAPEMFFVPPPQQLPTEQSGP